MIVFPNCKINLGLHILRKRPDGFHDLETVFYPVPWQDALEIVQHPSPASETEFTASGLTVDAPPGEISCVKAYGLLKKDFPDLPSVRMHLHKTIPSGAGLGGGSSDAAFALSLLNKKFGLGLNEASLMGYALQLGSDCPFFIRNQPCHATGRGENLEPVHLDLSGYKMILVHPKLHVATGKAFSGVHPLSGRTSIKEIIQKPVTQWKDLLINDFEDSIFTEYPLIRQIKEELYRQGAIYASMSGSGSTVFGLFSKETPTPAGFPGDYFVKLI